ncbi:S8 family peptidase [Anaerosporobacter faecicola]|uniref:S8 family peptidase n=1 Tax=Anaerosporobacter faecicola TaxID=2718714 RepID=UPI001438F0CD|nr:S8 family peptidase [Anaerosporobacter faecicola]
MNSGKRDNQLNLALDVTQETREQTLDLDVGFFPDEQAWELIVKYSGSLDRIRQDLQVEIVELLNEYAVMVIPESEISRLTAYEEIEFIEKPRHLVFAVSAGRAESCINPVQTSQFNLFGQGTVVSIIDSGIDYSHPDFRNEDGTTRIEALWDQTIPGKPPEGYAIGTVYTRDEINAALALSDPASRLSLVPSTDLSGHGTGVAGIACGNGRASQGRFRGVASQSTIIVVKLGVPVSDSFPKTTQLMQAIDFSVRTAIRLGQPIAINISFGNNYGSHDGRSLLEYYINDVANLWKSCISIGAGNEGARERHTSGQVTTGNSITVEFSVAEYERAFNLQLWKNYNDIISIEIISPSNVIIGPIREVQGTQSFVVDNTQVLFYYGEPIPFNKAQEIYFEFIPTRETVASGIWKIRLNGERVVLGTFDMWLPAGNAIGDNTRFLQPTPDVTLTIPSTTYRSITVGAYDGGTDSYANFSGRGFTREGEEVKPDMVAPGVSVTTTAPGGGYTSQTGTSFSTPFVTGSTALLMEWGIVNGNDPYLYGEKAKAYLIRGARRLPGFRVYPNPQVGWGALCLRDSLPI